MKRIHLTAAALLCAALLLISACALAAEVRPLEINPDDYDLDNGDYLLKLEDLDRIAEEEWFTAGLYVRMAFDAEQIRALAPGDTLSDGRSDYIVKEVRAEGEDGREVVLDNGDWWRFIPEGENTFGLYVGDWQAVVPVGQVKITLPLPDDFSYVEYADGDENLPEGAEKFLFNIAVWGKDFLPYNTTCKMKDGQLVYIFRTSYPYGPEEDYFVERQPAANAGYAWTPLEEDGWMPTIQNICGIEPFDTVLEDAEVLCFDCDEKGNLTGNGRGRYMAGFYRGLAMYAEVVGKVDDPPEVTGESRVCVFLDAEGEELMMIQLWNGYLATGTDLYLYVP